MQRDELIRKKANVADWSYTYTYDANGNIKTVSDGTYTTTYTYDNQNQLTREDNQRAGKTWVWTYDDAGNILSRAEYAYTTGTVGTVVSTKSYTYGNSNWGDLLTAYNGNTITSDTIGNMTSDGTWTYTWEHGRQLAGMTGTNTDGTENEVTISYTYDSNGMRTGKTVVTQTYRTHTHSYTSVVTAPTCTAAGYTTYTCACGDTYTGDTTSATGHSYTSVVTAATCTTDGYTTHTCTVCGYSYQDGTTAATGHSYQTVVDENGNTVEVCSRCGAGHEHVYNEIVVVEATCTGTGETLYECACGYYYVEITAALGHYFVPPVTLKSVCQRCGHSYVISNASQEAAEAGTEVATATETTVSTASTEEDRVLVSTVETTYSYVYNGSQLVQEVIVTKTTVDGTTTTATETLNYYYDASGTPMAVEYNGTMYYYVTNLQGDIVAILNTSGTTVATYTYDAWGNILTTSGTLATSLGTANSLRYRGYVFDSETNLYYLQSRYYDPEMGRFINADAFASTGQGLLGNNMFAYCGNNPINYVDPSGQLFTDIFAVCVDGCGGPGAVYATSDGKAQSDELLQYVLDYCIPSCGYWATASVTCMEVYSHESTVLMDAIVSLIGKAASFGLSYVTGTWVASVLQAVSMGASVYSDYSLFKSLTDPLVAKDYNQYLVSISWTQIDVSDGTAKYSTYSADIIFLWVDIRRGEEYWFIKQYDAQVSEYIVRP